MKWIITVMVCLMLCVGCTTLKRVENTSESIEHTIELVQLTLTNTEQAFVIWQKFNEGVNNPLIEAEKQKRIMEVNKLREILADLYKQKANK